MAGLTDTGFDALRSDDFLTIIRNEYQTRTGLTVDFTRDEVLGNLTAIMSVLLGAESELTQGVFDARDVNNATGINLTNLGLIVGVGRQNATFSTVVLTLGGLESTPIPQGSRAKGGGTDDLQEWESTVDAVIDSGGTVDVIFQAVDPGEIQAGVGEIDEIVNPVSGWDTVTNALVAEPGDNEETDAEFRIRRQNSLQISGSTSANALRANLLVVDGVTAAAVFDNDDSVPRVIEGVTIPAHAVIVVVDPSTLTDAQKEAVAQTIYDLLAIGIQTAGTDVIIQVTGKDLLPKDIGFDFATDLVIDIAAGIEVDDELLVVPSFIDDILPQVIQAIDDAFEFADLGVDFKQLPLLGAFSDIVGVRSATLVLGAPSDPSRTQATGDILVLGSEIAAKGVITVFEIP